MKLINRNLNIWNKFKSNKRNKFSLYIFSFIFIFSLFAEVISNDKPIVMSIDSELYYPILFEYSDKSFGGDFDTEANYKDDFMMNKLLIDIIVSILITLHLIPLHHLFITILGQMIGEETCWQD